MQDYMYLVQVVSGVFMPCFKGFSGIFQVLLPTQKYAFYYLK
jgi:hypothetical protein